MDTADTTTRTTPPAVAGRYLLPRVALALLASALFVAALLMLRSDPAWRLGQALWPAGFQFRGMALPMWGTRGLTWALLAVWLGLGPATLVRAARPWAWLMTLVVSVVVLALAGWWWVWLGCIVGFVVSFDPRWLPRHERTADAEPELVFYDGDCGFCHASVRRLALADADSGLFRFAPLKGRAAEKTLTPAQREALPDSIVLRTDTGKLLTQGDAVAHLLGRLGGRCRVLSWVLCLLPRAVRDFGYDRVAAIRQRLFSKPSGACPMMPAGMRDRFVP